MKILITGGAGFIGSNLAEKIIKKHKVVVIDNFNDTYNPTQKRKNIKEINNNKNYTLYEMDLRNKEEINKVFQKEKKFDCIIHLAGVGGVRPSEENPTFYYEENVISTINLVEVMKQYNCKNIIYFSSSSVYGNSNKNKFKETDITDTPVSIYAATKRSSEIMLYNYYINYHFNIVIIRPFTVYGPRQRPDLAIHTFTKKILNNEEITIFGDGSMIRDYTYVDDIVDGVIKAIDYMKTKKEQYEIFNLASSNPNSINKMVDIIQEITNKKAIIKYEEKPIGDVNKTYGDISKAKKLLNWTPQKNFKEGITNFIKWYKKENKKKIVFYTMAMIKGGTERTITNLANHYINDYDITIITNINGPIDYELNNKIKVIPIDKVNKINEKLPKKIITKTSPKRTKKLLNILQEENPDIVIVTLPEPTIRVLSIKKHLKNTKIITSIRNHPNSEFKSIIEKIIRNHYYKKSDIITIQDENYKKYFPNYLKNKIKIIPNYISDEFLSNNKRKKEKYIITVTRLERQKNIPLLINAFSKLDKKYKDYKLIIIGKGKEKKKLLKIIKKKKLIDKVIIKEPTNNIKDELEKSTLFVLPSNYEGMPNVLLEAMSVSLPVITTNSTEALKTFIINNKNGIIIPKNNQKELTKNIELLLENKEIRDNLGKEAIKIKDLYNEKNIIKKWDKIIKKNI